MIRSCRLTITTLNAWLIDQQIVSAHRKYRLRVWKEDRESFADIREEVFAYFDEALDDARKRIRQGFEDDLSPFNTPGIDPAASYPAMLHHVTLQGYFGETLAAVAIEHWGAHGHDDWQVPAFLFRAHDTEFQHLESINERLVDGAAFDPDAIAEKRPGRTGDDCLAFRCSAKGKITDVLAIEAKCLSLSQNAKIEDAHKKLAAAGKKPSGVRELINLLSEYDTPEAQAWQAALLSIWKSGLEGVRRHDAICYVCGKGPSKQKSWLPADAPHESYKSTRSLEGLEFHCPDLTNLVKLIYRGT